LTGHIHQRSNVIRVIQHVRLKAGYLAGERRVPVNGVPSDYVTHDGIDPILRDECNGRYIETNRSSGKSGLECGET